MTENNKLHRTGKTHFANMAIIGSFSQNTDT